MSAALFWASCFLLVYVYLGYPLVAWLRGHFYPKRANRAPIEPFVSVIVVAHDEADRIGARIENLLASDYPAGKLELIVASDGSTDATAEIAERYAGRVLRKKNKLKDSESIETSTQDATAGAASETESKAASKTRPKRQK